MQIWLPLVSDGQPPPLRLGVGIAHQRDHAWRDRSLALLKPPCWKDWLWDHNKEIHGYMPAVFVLAPSESNTQAMEGAGEELWELGNEPSWADPPTPPTVAAEFVREWQARVGNNFAAPGVILWSTGLAWLARYLDAGGPVGNFWNVHHYFANDADDWSRIWELWCSWQQSRAGWNGPPCYPRPTAPWAATRLPSCRGLPRRCAPTRACIPRYGTATTICTTHFMGQNLVTAGALALTPLGEHYRGLLGG